MVRAETGDGATLAGRPELGTILDFIYPGYPYPGYRGGEIGYRRGDLDRDARGRAPMLSGRYAYRSAGRTRIPASSSKISITAQFSRLAQPRASPAR